MSRKQLRGGNSSIVRNGVLYGSSPSNCLRMVLLRHHGVEFQPDERSLKVFTIGHLNEELFERDYLAGIEGLEKEKNVVVGLSDSVDFSGHIDYSTPGLLYELKSCTSDNTHRKVFTQGKYKIENLIQLATYLFMTETSEGYLCYTSYTDKIQYKTLDKVLMDDIVRLAEESDRETIKILVTFNENGEVIAKGKGSGVFISDILEFQNTAVNVLENQVIHPDRPEPFEANSRFTACSNCPLNRLCDEWETKRWDSETFIKKAKSITNKSKEEK